MTWNRVDLNWISTWVIKGQDKRETSSFKLFFISVGCQRNKSVTRKIGQRDLFSSENPLVAEWNIRFGRCFTGDRFNWWNRIGCTWGHRCRGWTCFKFGGIDDGRKAFKRATAVGATFLVGWTVTVIFAVVHAEASDSFSIRVNTGQVDTLARFLGRTGGNWFDLFVSTVRFFTPAAGQFDPLRSTCGTFSLWSSQFVLSTFPPWSPQFDFGSAASTQFALKPKLPPLRFALLRLIHHFVISFRWPEEFFQFDYLVLPVVILIILILLFSFVRRLDRGGCNRCHGWRCFTRRAIFSCFCLDKLTVLTPRVIYFHSTLTLNVQELTLALDGKDEEKCNGN